MEIDPRISKIFDDLLNFKKWKYDLQIDLYKKLFNSIEISLNNQKEEALDKKFENIVI